MPATRKTKSPKARRPATRAKPAAKPAARRLAKPAANRIAKPAPKSKAKPAAKPVKRVPRAPKPTDRERIAQLAAEIALVNGVQRGVARSLDFQAIIDLVGDKLRQVFPGAIVGIRIFDAEANLMHYPYLHTRGKKRKVPSEAPSGFGAEVIRTRKTLLVNHDMDKASARVRSRGSLISGVGEPKSQLMVPMLVSGQVRGMLTLNDEREHAYSESDVRLLESLAASLSVALENARLFDETQRLLKVTEQRATRARGDQQHPARDGREAGLPGHHRSGR